MTTLETHPVHDLWRDPHDGVVARIAAFLMTHDLHPARTLVLVPYAQLMAVGRAEWARSNRAGFAPRFETARNWARSVAGFLPTGYDLAFDRARDLVTAQALLAQVPRLGPQRNALAGRLVEVALQLAPLAAGVAPGERAGWAERATRTGAGGNESPFFETERTLATIAASWAATSGYATDALLGDVARAQVDALVVLEAFQPEPMSQALAQRWGDRALRLSLVLPADDGPATALHAASDPEDEAERSAACVLRHLADGRAPVALVATDRALARRISAELVAQGVLPHDETGWKLSTTRTAATLMGALRAAGHAAGGDQVLDWLKSAPAFDPLAVQALEARLRAEGQREWAGWVGRVARSAQPKDIALLTLTDDIEARRATLLRARPLGDWLSALRDLLQGAGQWDALAGDFAGAKALAALWLDAEPGELGEIGGDRYTLADFTAWTRDVLEAGSFVPPAGGRVPQVVVLPLPQLLGRAFGAVVLPGCDDRHLPASPEPPGNWTTDQRAELGLPSREMLEAAQRAAWASALRQPYGDVLWRTADAAGEPVRPSPLVQSLVLDDRAAPADDPRDRRAVPVAPTPRPQPVGARLPLRSVSATVYEDLRRCPYRFFALRQLGLRGADELDAEVGKRDFGNWLHAVLGHFHEALKTAADQDRPARLAMISIAEQRATRDYGLSAAEFLPFAAAWPAVRDGYLDWLDAHERAGHRFDLSEPWLEQSLGTLRLTGRLDRVDRTADGRAFVIDYKTEAAGVTKERVKDPTEDTQLAFYAALMADDTLRAGYVNVGEMSSGTQTVEQADVVEARDALVAGLMDDFARIDAGAALPALGEGRVCEHCDARGLCRKDFWTDTP